MEEKVKVERKGKLGEVVRRSAGGLVDIRWEDGTSSEGVNLEHYKLLGDRPKVSTRKRPKHESQKLRPCKVCDKPARGEMCDQCRKMDNAINRLIARNKPAAWAYLETKYDDSIRAQA